MEPIRSFWQPLLNQPQPVKKKRLRSIIPRAERKSTAKETGVPNHANAQWVVGYIKNNPGCTGKQIIFSLGIAQDSYYRATYRLVSAGCVERVAFGNSFRYWWVKDYYGLSGTDKVILTSLQNNGGICGLADVLAAVKMKCSIGFYMKKLEQLGMVLKKSYGTYEITQLGINQLGEKHDHSKH